MVDLAALAFEKLAGEQGVEGIVLDQQHPGPARRDVFGAFIVAGGGVVRAQGGEDAGDEGTLPQGLDQIAVETRLAATGDAGAASGPERSGLGCGTGTPDSPMLSACDSSGCVAGAVPAAAAA